MNKPLRIALTKGRLEKDTVGLFEKLGYDCTSVHEKEENLYFRFPTETLKSYSLRQMTLLLTLNTEFVTLVLSARTLLWK